MMRKQEISDCTKAQNEKIALEPFVLDIRPLFQRGVSPCGVIDSAVAGLQPGQDFILIAPFEPVPLFTKLAAQGFTHETEAAPDGSWRIRFVRTGERVVSDIQSTSCCG